MKYKFNEKHKEEKKAARRSNRDKQIDKLLEVYCNTVCINIFLEELSKQYSNDIILSTFFSYPAEIRKIIYTTNIIEGLNRQFRKITKNKPSFTNDDSLRRILYLASKNITSHWTVICRNWDLVSNQLSIMFTDRETA